MKSRKNAKTKIKLLGPDEVWQPKLGGRPGNSNARKSGLHTAELKALRRRLRNWQRRARAALGEG